MRLASSPGETGGPDARPGPDWPEDAGTTLIEIMVALVILSTAVLATMGLLTTLIAGAVQARESAQADNLAVEAAETVKLVGFQAGCLGGPADLPAGTVEYRAASDPFFTPDPWTWNVEKVAYRAIEDVDGDGHAGDEITPESVCASNADALHEVTVKVTHPDDEASATRTVSLRKPCEDEAFDARCP